MLTATITAALHLSKGLPRRRHAARTYPMIERGNTNLNTPGRGAEGGAELDCYLRIYLRKAPPG